jgi:ankyrin repeat protein
LHGLTKNESIQDSELNDLLLSLVKSAKNDAEATIFANSLIRHGAKPVSKDSAMTSRNWTALHWAAYKGYSSCITAILNSYADVTDQQQALAQKTAMSFNYYVQGNQTTFDVAKQYDQKAVCELLDRHMNPETIDSVSVRCLA